MFFYNNSRLAGVRAEHHSIRKQLFLKLASILLMLSFSLWGYAQTPNPLEGVDLDVNDNAYDIFFGDLNSDGRSDLYFHAKERFILLHGDIAIPIVLQPQTSFAYYAELVPRWQATEIPNNQTLSDICDPNLPTQDQQLCAYYMEMVVDYDKPSAIEPQLTEANISQLGLVEIASNNYHFGDFTGNGRNDVMVVVNDGVFIARMQPNAALSEAEKYDDILGGEGQSVLAGNYEVYDHDNDGRVEIVFEGGLLYEDVARSVDMVGFSTEYNVSHENLKTATLNAASDGSFKVSEAGAATYSLPILSPEGVAGVAPSISINYSSQAGNGPLGLGWSISGLSSISRCRQSLFQDGKSLPINWTDSDRFCLNGQRLVEVSSSAGYTEYRTEINNHSIVKAFGSKASPTYFSLEAKDGSITYFGQAPGATTTDARQTNSGKVLAWAIKQFEDSVGNKIVYNYLSPEASNNLNFLISSIEYAYGASSASNSDAHARINFLYSDRPDHIGGYTAGYYFGVTQRLQEITVENKVSLTAGGAYEWKSLRSYNLFYHKESKNDLYVRSFLEKVQECAYDGTVKSCLPATSFNWEATKTAKMTKKYEEDIIQNQSSLVQIVPFDFNGDSYPDLVWVEDDQTPSSGRNTRIHYSEYKPDTQSYLRRAFVGGDYDFLQYDDNQTKLDQKIEIQTLDYNNDGRQDLAVFRKSQQRWDIHLSRPSSSGTWYLTANPIRIDTTYGTENVLNAEGARFMDMNGDGLTDYVTQSGLTVHYLKPREGADLASNTYYQFETKPTKMQWPARSELSHSVEPTGVYTEVLELKRVLSFQGDFTGDGSLDYLLRYSVTPKYYPYGIDQPPQNGDTEEHVYIAKAEGQALKIVKYIGIQHGSDFQVGDVNLDGLSDLVYGGTLSSGIFFRLNNGDGFDPPVTLHTFPASAGEGLKLRIGDITNDGFPDVYWAREGAASGYRSWNTNILGFDPVNEPPVAFEYDFLSRPLVYMHYDFSGDGNIDTLKYKDNTVSLWVNNATTKNGVITSIENGLGAITNIRYDMLNKSDRYSRVAGLRPQTTTTTSVPSADSCTAYYPDQCAAIEVERESFSLSEGDFYRQINDPTSGMNAGTGSLASAFNTPVQEYFAPVLLVTTVESSAPSYSVSAGQLVWDEKARIEYFYDGAKIQAGGKGYLGFRSLTTLDPQTGVRTQVHYRQDWPYVGAPVQTAVYAPSGDLLSIEHTDWELKGWQSSWLTSVANGTSTLGPLSLVNTGSTKYSFEFHTDTSVDGTTGEHKRETLLAQYDSSADAESDSIYCLIGDSCKSKSSSPQKVLQKVLMTQSYDDYGNVVTQSSETEGKGLSLNVTTTTEYGTSTDAITFADGRSLSYRQLGRITKTSVNTIRDTHDLGTKDAVFTYYDNKELIAGSGFYGQPGQIKSETANLSSIAHENKSKHYQYDQYGNIVQTEVKYVDVVYDGNDISTYSTSNKSRYSRIIFDDLGRYVVSNLVVRGDGSEVITDTVISRDKYGNPVSVEDNTTEVAGVAKRVTTSDYDILGRSVGVSDSTGAWSETEYKICSSALKCPEGTSYVVEKRGADGGLGRTYTDIVGRTIRVATRSFDGRMVFQDTEYDILGRVHRTSEPYFEDNSALYWTTNKYDFKGRPVEINGPDGSISLMAYYGDSVTTTNALGFSKTKTTNGLGELYSVTDESGAEIIYDYNQDGELTQIKVYEEAGNYVSPPIITTFDFDDLGRKTLMNDPDKGIWHYRYNSLGDLVYQKDAKGQVVTQEYDDLGRMLRRTDYDSAGAVAQHTRWYYDGVDDQGVAVANATMRATAQVMSAATTDEQCTSATASYCEYYTYDQFGRATQTGVVLAVKELGSSIYTDKGTYTTGVAYDNIGRAIESYDALNGTVKLGTTPVTNSGTRKHFNAYGYLEFVEDMASGTRVYETLSTTARGAISRSRAGNGLTQTHIYDDVTGRLTHKYAGVTELDVAADWSNTQLFGVQKIKYEWDVVGNLTYRHNRSGAAGSNKDIQESFCYDSVNRLIKTVNGPLAANYCATMRADSTQAGYDLKYDSLGNITYKNNMGDYTYGATTYSPGAGVHAVTKTVKAGVTTEYKYDANGNMEEDKVGAAVQRKLWYSTFDKPLHIQKGDHNSHFRYSPGRNRYWRKDVSGDGKETEVLYLGGVERVTRTDGANTQVIWKRYLGGGALFDVETTENNTLVGTSLSNSTTQSYLYKDHLGSVDVITDAVGTVISNLSFNEWGERRNATSFNPPTASDILTFTQYLLTAATKTNRGFTGHEMLDEVGLVHMNGRIYDARLARFLQADPLVQSPTHTQSYNRYSYVWNNPLNATDPSGFETKWRYWRQGAVQVVAVVAAVVATVACYYYAGCGLTAYSMIMGLIGAASSAAMGASSGEVMAAFAISALTAYVGGGGLGINQGAQVLVMGVIGGISARLNGGRFANGFFSGVIGATMGTSSGQISNPVARIGTSALIGGASTKITGGKFANGAATSAFSALLSSFVPKRMSAEKFERTSVGSTPVLNVTFGGSSGAAPIYAPNISKPNSQASTLSRAAPAVAEEVVVTLQPVKSPFVYSSLPALLPASGWVPGQADIDIAYAQHKARQIQSDAAIAATMFAPGGVSTKYAATAVLKLIRLAWSNPDVTADILDLASEVLAWYLLDRAPSGDGIKYDPTPDQFQTAPTSEDGAPKLRVRVEPGSDKLMYKGWPKRK